MLDVPSLISTILGAFIAVGSAWLFERWRRKREDETRWLDARRACYVRFLATSNAALHKLIELSVLSSAWRGATKAEKLGQALMEMTFDLVSAFFEIRLVASKETINAAQKVQDLLMDLGQLLTGSSESGLTWEAAPAKLGELTADLIEVMRRELDVKELRANT